MGDRLLMDDPPVVIAEIGGNHGGDPRLARAMVDAAADAGATWVKFQTYVPERLLRPSESAFAGFQREALSFEQFRALATHCRRRGVVFFSTPFDEASADFLEELDVPVFKIASGDLTHLPLLSYVAKKHRPILLSTGASTWEEIDTAVRTIRAVSGGELILLHCIAAYPTPDSQANLRLIPALRTRYGTRVGFSDHTLGIDVALAAAALGAEVIEKHFTTDRSLPGGDNAMSILPEELAHLIAGSRRIWAALGSPERRVTPAERTSLPCIRRSLTAARDIPPGTVVTRAMVSTRRPGTGIPPGELGRVVGRRTFRGLKAEDVMHWSDLERVDDAG